MMESSQNKPTEPTRAVPVEVKNATQIFGEVEVFNTQHVKIVDISIPFWSIVAFMIKWAVASIPAGLFLGFVVFGLSAFLRACTMAINP